MKDQNDKQTLDLLTGKRGRGRPRKPDALTGAQRQAAYRKNTVTVTLSIDEAMDLRAVALKAGHLDLVGKLREAIGKRLNCNSDEKTKAAAAAFEKPVTVTENTPLVTPAVQPDQSVTVTKNDRFVVRYVHPDNPGLTWTGRGRKPLWVVECIDRGLTLDQLEVK